MNRRPEIPNGFRALSVCILSCLMLSCQVPVSVDDNGDAGPEGEPIPELEDDPISGFPNVTVISLGGTGVGFDGADLVLVVDNSETMLEEQALLASEVYAIISTLTHPLDGRVPVRNLRVATTTTDMGLQWGEDWAFEEFPDMPECAGVGDNGSFVTLPEPPPLFALKNYSVPCDASAVQCPEGWACTAGYCTAPESGNLLSCDFDIVGSWIETTEIDPDPLFAQKAACSVLLGNRGCTVEQPLAALRRALRRQPAFLAPSHLLAAVILSDEEDCSVDDPSLFQTDEWLAPETRQIACSDPGRETDYLLSPDAVAAALVAAKNGNRGAVLLAAAVGAPFGAVCTGDGDALWDSGCLDDSDMTMFVEEYPVGVEMKKRFRPACSSTGEDADGARPGRRFVELAQLLGHRGFVQSICESTYRPLVNRVVDGVERAVAHGSCLLSDALEMELAQSEDCRNCVKSRCELYVEIVRTGEAAEDLTCPGALVYGTGYNRKAAFKSEYDGETLVSRRLFCPLEKIPAPSDCVGAASMLSGRSAGWAYCENGIEDEITEYACSDGVDNNGDGKLDCDDPRCGGCLMCGGETGCPLGCRYSILLTDPAARTVAGNNLFLECPFR